MKIGEEREIQVKFPDDYHAENLAGKDATFKVKLISIKEKLLPNLDDEFAKDVSEFETLEEYKKDLEEKLKEEKVAQANSAKEQKALEKLVENTEVNIPEGMIDNEVEKMVDEFKANLSYQGLTIEKYCEYVGSTLDEFKANLRPNAKKDVTLKLALEYVAKAENINVEEKEIDEKIQELVKQYGSDEKADNFKNNENIRHYVKDQLIQEKSVKVVVDNAIEK